jgi:transcriptional regulator with PAS, ATPase and Fis domain
VILRRLSFFKGSRTQTAQDLGISIRNLQYKLEKYDIR